MRKRISLLLAVIGLLCLLCAAQAAAEPDAPYLILDKTELELEKERAAKLTCSLAGTEELIVRTNWSSSDDSVASVSNGKVTAKKNAGIAVITCTAVLTDGTKLSAFCRVEVVLPVSSVKLIPGTVSLLLGEEGKAIRCAVAPAEAKDRMVSWYSADERIATVDENGFVTPVSAGKTTVTAISNADRTKKASAAVTVRQPVTSIEFPQAYAEIAQGKTMRLAATVKPENANDKKVIWASSDRSVVRISNGVLEAKAPGVATVICTAADGSGTQSSFEVEVYAGVRSVSATPRTATVFLGRPAVPLSVKVAPADAKYPSVTWRSSDERIATVDEDGSVTPVAAGKVTVTAVSDDDPTKKATVAITVMKPVTSIVLDKQNCEMEKGTSAKVTAAVSPADATDRRVIWTSSAPAVVSVANGALSAKKTGTAVITASAADGSGVSASFTVDVTQIVTGVKFASPKISLTLGEPETVAPIIQPADATDTRMIWTSDNEKIVSADRETGVLSPLALGVCTVTATAADGSGITASAAVTVEPVLPVEAIRLSRSGTYGYSEFALTLRNLTVSRAVNSLGFTVEYNSGGKRSAREFFIDKLVLSPGMTKQVGRWEFGYELSYATDIRIYLTSARYADGRRESFQENNLIGWFA